MNFVDSVIELLINIVMIVIPLGIAIYLCWFLWRQWVNYIRNKWLDKQEFVLLQLVLPKDVMKSPKAMELFLNSLHQTGGEGSKKMKYIEGITRASFSLEIAGIDGNIFFFLRTSEFFKSYITSQLYAQWPDIDIVEVEDYSLFLDTDDPEASGHKIWTGDMKLVAPDPVPIKTYVDYGLEREGIEEEEKIDPITSLLEYLANLRKGEQAWIQIITRAHKDEDKKPGTFFGTTDSWQDKAKELIDEIKDNATPKDEEGRPGFPNLTKGDQLKIEAIERSISKLGFDVGIHVFYIAEKDLFTPANIAGLVGSFKQYGAGNLNGFKPSNTAAYDYKWQDPFGKKSKKIKSMAVRAYQRRGFFYPPFDIDGVGRKRPKIVLNTEELATIFHFPGRVAETPTFARVASRRSEPPADLPT